MFRPSGTIPISFHPSIHGGNAPFAPPNAGGAGVSVCRAEELFPDMPRRMPDVRIGYHTILLLRSGDGRRFSDGLAMEIGPMHVAGVAPGPVERFEFEVLPRGHVVSFDGAFLSAFVEEDPHSRFPWLFSPTHLSLQADPATFGILSDQAEHLLAAYTENGPHWGIIGHLLAVLLYRMSSVAGTSRLPPRKPESSLICRFVHHVNAVFAELTAGSRAGMPKISEIGRELGVHPDYLSSTLRRNTGMNAREWLARRRITESKILLSRGAGSVSEIAYTLGFSEPGHFTRAFKRAMGVSPSEFRETCLAEREEICSS